VPPVIARANELIASAGNAIERCPLTVLRRNPDLLGAHLTSLLAIPVLPRGKVDPDLAVACAKIEEAKTFEEAVAFLEKHEAFAVLLSQKTLGKMMMMP